MHILDFLFPRRCIRCGKVGRYICRKCYSRIKLREQRCPECDKPAIDGLTHPLCRTRYGLDGLITVFRNEGIVKKAIKLLKYRFVTDVAETLISAIPTTIYQSLSYVSSGVVLYPIPLHKDRLKWRGFNQAEKLGQYLSKQLKIPLAYGLLDRSIKRTPQAEIPTREDRIKNAQGLFSLSPKYKTSKSLNILLFDDVWTTGATLKEATRVLKKGRVEKVYALTFAR